MTNKSTRICYLILLHHKFEQAKRLINRLNCPEASFVIHVDAKVKPDVFEQFKRDISHIQSAQFINNRVDAKWGSFELTLAMLRLIQFSVKSNIQSERYMLISGQDYPLLSNDEILDFLSQHPHEEYMEYSLMDIDDEKAVGWSPYYRFRRYHFWVGRTRRVLPFLVKKKPNIPMYHGAQWWLLTSKAIGIIASEFENNRSWNKFIRTGFLTDEAYIPSVLMSSAVVDHVVGKSATYADWKNITGPHPKTLTMSDWDGMISSGCVFARKFDMNQDEDVLDALDVKANYIKV